MIRNPLSVTTRAKISAARRRRKEKLGYINSPETRLKIGAASRGKSLGPSPLKGRRRPKISMALKGRKRPDISAKLKGRKRPDISAMLKGRTRPDISARMRDLLRNGPQDPTPCEICIGKQTRGLSIARDHDHDLGHWRGLLCQRCNMHLRHFEDALRGKDTGRYPTTDAWMFSALRYLKRHGSRWRVA